MPHLNAESRGKKHHLCCNLGEGNVKVLWWKYLREIIFHFKTARLLKFFPRKVWWIEI
jgi:hypothetical protein